MQAFRLTRYLRNQKKVDGWLEPDAALLTLRIDACQKTHDVRGGICEIGVHHGRYFILLELLRREGEAAVAVDVFDHQHLNRDQSGLGNKQTFCQNVSKFGSSSESVQILEADSMTLVPDNLPGPFRLFSVDGGHTHNHARNDLKLAEACCANGGVVMLDDILNTPWCEVVYGFARYKQEGGTLIPFAIFGGKLYLTNDGSLADEYRSLASEVFENRYILATRDFFGSQVCTHFYNLHPRVRLSFLLQRSSLGRVFRNAYRGLKSVRRR